MSAVSSPVDPAAVQWSTTPLARESFRGWPHRLAAASPSRDGLQVYVPKLFFTFLKIFENFALQIPEKDSEMNTNTKYTKFLLSLSLITTFVAAQALAQQIKPDETKRIELNHAYGKLPLSFEANQGQTDPQVKFLSRGNGYSLFLTPTEAVLVLKKAARDNNAHPGVMPSQTINNQHKTSQSSLPATVLRMKLVGGNVTAKIAGTGELPGKSNYLIGNDPKQWRTNLSNYTKVEYRDVYPGVDLVYYGNQQQLEYDFVVRPGADPARIRMDIAGADEMRVDANGGLVVQTTGGEVRWNKPLIYQNIDGKRHEVNGRYALRRGHEVGFELAAHDKSRSLVIDPTLSYSTYLGGGSDDLGEGIAVDNAGNAYVTGSTSSTNFPTSVGAFQTTILGGSAAFVTKLNPTGTSLIYSTYLGGSRYDTGYGVAVDASGNAYVTGLTSSTNFPTTVGAFQTTTGGGGDAFVAKLNPTGAALIYSTYLGGSTTDYGTRIAVDASGNAYVTGYTESGNFPTTVGLSRRRTVVAPFVPGTPS